MSSENGGTQTIRKEVKKRMQRYRNTLLTWCGILAIVFGLGAIGFGTAGAVYTHNTAMKQGITVSGDATMGNPGATLDGPFDMLGQAGAIEHHMLERTEGKYYAQMDREDPVRASWLDATTLMSALQLGAMAYALAAFVIFFGFTSLGTGVVFFLLRE